MQLDISSDPNFDLYPPAIAWKAELKRIVEFLNRGDEDSESLWVVLSALRGPDVPDRFEELKAATTAVIRHTAGLRMKGLVILPDSERSLAVRRGETEDGVPQGHFAFHAMNAFSQFGLTWCSVNKSAEEAA